MQLTYEQKIEACNRIKHFVDMGNSVFNTDMDFDNIRVRFDKRGTTAGTALYINELDMELDFNVGLMVDNWDEFMNDTIPHEVAHLFKNHMYGTDRKGRMQSPHGYYWQQIMRRLGVDPSRCHSMDVSKVAMPKTKHIYKCSCCQEELVISQVRHNKMRRGGRVYFHSPCGKEGTLQHVRALGKISNKEAIQHKQAGTAPAPTMKKAAQKKAPKKRSEPKAGTIAARALEIYRKFAGEDRKTVIGEIALTLNVTDKRAAQIYQGAKRNAQEFGA